MRWICRALLLAALFVLTKAVPRPRSRHDLHRGPSWTTFGDHTSGRVLRTTQGKPVQLSHVMRQTGTKKSTFTITPPVTIPSGLQIEAAIAEVKNIMESTWPSDQTVNVLVTFAKIGGKDVLANGGGVTFARSTVLNEMLPIAAAESIDKVNKNGDSADMEVVMNDGATWYTGVDAAAIPATSYDFITVLLHEIYHNLIFSGRFFVDVNLDAKAPGGVTQTAKYTTGDEPTRFDKFVANAESCSVLGYLNATSLVTSTSKTPEQLLADSLTNGKVFFAPSDSPGSIAKLYSPRIWIPKSSAYHLDPSVSTDTNDVIMYPQIPLGRAVRSIGIGVLNIQVSFLNTNVKGAKICDPATLVDPTPGTLPSPGDRAVLDTAHGGTLGDGRGTGTGTGTATGPTDLAEPVRRIGGMKVWVFALVVTFSIIGGILLIALCIFLVLTCLKARKKGKQSSYDEYAGYDETTRDTDIEEGEGDEGVGEGENGENGEQPGPYDSEGTVSGDIGPKAGDSLEGNGADREGASGEGDGNGGPVPGAPGIIAVPPPGLGGPCNGSNGKDEGIGTDDSSGDKASKRPSKKGSSGKGRGGPGGSLDYTDSNGVSGSGGRDPGMGRSVCPSTRGRVPAPCAPPRTFDPSSVPSRPSKSKRGGSSTKSISRSKSRKDYSSSGSGTRSDYLSDMKPSKKSGSGGVKPGSICPPTVAPGSSHRGGSGGGGCGNGVNLEPFDCDTTIFDCENVSAKLATKFAVSNKPIPKLVNPTTGSTSRYIYLDSETTDSTHLRPYERGSALKNPVAHPRKPPQVVKPTTLVSRTTDPSSMYYSSFCSCSECYGAGSEKKTTMVMCRKSEGSKSSKSIHSEGGKSSCKKKSDCGKENAPSNGKRSGSSCPRSKSKESIHRSSSSCKKSGSVKSIKSSKSKECLSPPSCKPPSIDPTTTDFSSVYSDPPKAPASCDPTTSEYTKPDPPKLKSTCPTSVKSEIRSHRRSSSCKRSGSSKSIKSSKSKDCKSPPPPCKVPAPSCNPTSTDFSSSDFTAPADPPKAPPSCGPSTSEISKPDPPILKSTCPTSEKKAAMRYHGSSRRHRRRKSGDGFTTTDFTFSDSEETTPRRKHKERVTTRVTTKQTLAKYEDGKLVNKKHKAKETTKKYRPMTEDTSYYDDSTFTTPVYTDSYFMSEDVDDDKTEKKSHRHHRSKSNHSKSHHSKHRHRSRSRSDGDELRRSKSEKVGVRHDHRSESRHKTTRDDGLTRTTSKRDLRRSKSHHHGTTRHVPIEPPMTRETRRTDIHTVALDPEVSKKYEKEKSRRREKSASRHERSTRHHERERETRDKTDGATVVKKKKKTTTTKVRVEHHGDGHMRIIEPTTTDFSVDSKPSFDDITTTNKSKARSRSRSRVRYTTKNDTTSDSGGDLKISVKVMNK